MVLTLENSEAAQPLAEAAREDQDREQDVTNESQRPEEFGKRQASSTTQPSAGKGWPPASKDLPTARPFRHGSAPTRTRAHHPVRPWPRLWGAAGSPARCAEQTAG